MKYIRLLLILFSLHSFSQNVSLNWSDKMKTNGDEVIVGANKGDFFTRNITKDNTLIFKTFNAKAQLQKETDANFQLGNIEFDYLGNHISNKKIIHFLSETKRKKKSFHIYAATTNTNFEPSGETLVLTEVIDEKMMNYGISFSPDSTKLVVWTEFYKKNKKKANTIHYKIFDAELQNVLLDKTIVLEDDAKNLEISNCFIDDYQNFYVSSVKTKAKKEQKKTEAPTYVNVTIYGKNNEVKEIAYDYTNKIVNSSQVYITSNNTLVLVGFLSPIIKGFLKGKKGELVSDELIIVKHDCKTFNEIDNKIISVDGLYPEKVSKNSEYVPYRVKDVSELKNGGHAIVAEQYKAVYHSQPQNGGYYVYFHCDIAVINLDKASEVTAMVKIPKYQKDAKNPSLLSTTYKGKTYVVYEDKTKNEDINTDNDIKKSSSSIFSRDTDKSLFLVTMNERGDMKKEILYSYDNRNIRSDFRKSMVIKEGQIMLNANDYIGILQIK